MQVYVYRHGFCVFGRVKDVRRLLRQYAREYTTVQDLINHRLGDKVRRYH
ncbi:MAG: Z-ring formation inhibitor MciZ [Bacillota bacterium]